MCFRCLSGRSLTLAALAVFPVFAAPDALRVCADPNNLPFSNQRGEGFENQIASVLARDLHTKVEFVWWKGHHGSIKHTLDENLCDVLMGVPTGADDVSLTSPYYRSSYVFVSRQDRGLHLVSLNDRRLEHLRIGIQMAGDDFAPPAAALAHRGVTGNVVGYSLFGAYGEANPAARLIDAVAKGDIDIAIAWGPLGGYFAKHAAAPLVVTPVSPASYGAVPFVFDMAVGVRKGDGALLASLNAALVRNCAAIRSILDEFGIPRAPGGEGSHLCEASPRSRAASLH